MPKEKVLIVGNADQPIPADINLADYRWIAVFNEPRQYPQLLKLATHHFFRMGARVWAGVEHIPEETESCRLCFIDPETTGNEIIQKYKLLGKKTRNVYTSDCRTNANKTYPSGFCPSSGFCAIKWFMDFNVYDITVINFTFVGVRAHNWDHERLILQKLHAEKKINLVYEQPKVEKFAGTRLAHFVWLSPKEETRELSGRMWYSIMSFMALHPHWKTTLHTNCSFQGTYVDQCIKMGLQIRQVKVPLDGNIVNEADALKWLVLRDFGGLVLDVADTLTTGNFDEIHDHASILKWTHWTLAPTTMAAGWFCCHRPNIDIARHIQSRYNANRQPLAPTGLWEKTSFEIRNECTDIEKEPINRLLVFGASVADMENIVIPNNDLSKCYAGALQLHFYSGNTWASERHLKKRASLDSYAIPENWQNNDNIYTIPFLQTISKASNEFRTKFLEVVGSDTKKIESDWKMPEHVVVISLPTRQDRRDLIQKEADAIGLQLIYFDGFYPPQGAKGWSRGPGEIGCAISHQAVIRMAMAMSWDSVMILEDDAVIKPDFLDKMNYLLAYTPSTSNILNIGWHKHLKTPEIMPISKTVGKPIIKAIWGTQAYIVRKESYRKLLDQWEKYREAIDIDLSNSPHLEPVYAIESLVQQRNLHGDSNIKPAGKPAVMGRDI